MQAEIDPRALGWLFGVVAAGGWTWMGFASRPCHDLVVDADDALEDEMK
jgi:hypothetical protein